MGFDIRTVTLSTLAGSKVVTYPGTFGVNIKQVSREGLVYDIRKVIIGTPINRQCCIKFAGRVFEFANEFAAGETVTIKWIV